MRFFRITYSRTAICTSISLAVWFAVMAYGELLNGAPNSGCYPYLGCDSGFFGYDALEHFLFGFAAAWSIVWLCQKFPRHSILHIEFWKSALMVIALVTLIEIIWEIGECFRDAYLLDIVHQQLFNFRLHINYLAQPSNFDTMGDITFNLLGSLLALPFIKRLLGSKSVDR